MNLRNQRLPLVPFRIFCFYSEISQSIRLIDFMPSWQRYNVLPEMLVLQGKYQTLYRQAFRKLLQLQRQYWYCLLYTSMDKGPFP